MYPLLYQRHRKIEEHMDSETILFGAIPFSVSYYLPEYYTLLESCKCENYSN
ncbi:MAG: hypothetical protein K9L17_01635 [Clostridiales bacterium]|nr:hypothetical protein [Clostridiales bacterium]